MIKVKFQEKKPKYFGYSGLHLYKVNSQVEEGVKVIELSHDADAIDMYKLYHDVAMFLSDTVNPSMKEKNVCSYPIYGNPDHTDQIMDRRGPQAFIVGYLDSVDVKETVAFLSKHSFENKEYVSDYYNKLSSSVKEELDMLLGEAAVDELHAYVKNMLPFFQSCSATDSEVILISNG